MAIFSENSKLSKEEQLKTIDETTANKLRYSFSQMYDMALDNVKEFHKKLYKELLKEEGKLNKYIEQQTEQATWEQIALIDEDGFNKYEAWEIVSPKYILVSQGNR